MNSQKRLTRSKDKMIAGVLSGIANYFDVDPTIVRIVYAILSLATIGFPGVVAYVIMWIIVPEEKTY